MAHFAYIDNDNRVTQVIVCDQDQIDTGAFGDPARWIQTSYNTRAGVHIQGGTPFRKNFAGVGMTYNAELDAFIGEKSCPSWVLDPDTCQYVPPRPQPEKPSMFEAYVWNEDIVDWVLINMLDENTPE